MAAKAVQRQARVAKAARLQRLGVSTREIASALGVNVKTARLYLRESAPHIEQVNGRDVTEHERRVLSAAVARNRQDAAGLLAGLLRAG